ncbi:MAG: ubiquinone/menaquinone biosynthesis C-methylase UbiE [Cocleimonas sp.]|jgi:ubiquinone/menaquinone biosynthesis C-methylase UbiE
MDIFSKWESGIENELIYWDKWFDSKGGKWPEDYNQRLDLNSLLQDHVIDCIDANKTDVRILDVGAGPLTILGKNWPGHNLDIVASDALSDRYDTILAQYKISPPIRTKLCRSEELSQCFDHNSFDFSYARNTLDHGLNPLTAILEMIKVVKSGHNIMIEHFLNEGATGNYIGLHQWNFEIRDNDLVIWNPDVELSVREGVKSVGKIVNLTSSKRTCSAIIKKHL